MCLHVDARGCIRARGTPENKNANDGCRRSSLLVSLSVKTSFSTGNSAPAVPCSVVVAAIQRKSDHTRHCQAIGVQAGMAASDPCKGPFAQGGPLGPSEEPPSNAPVIREKLPSCLREKRRSRFSGIGGRPLYLLATTQRSQTRENSASL